MSTRNTTIKTKIIFPCDLFRSAKKEHKFGVPSAAAEQLRWVVKKPLERQGCTLQGRG